ncbi:MAG: hypothetical protein ACRD1L_06900 [Terriglobales bacterium]
MRLLRLALTTTVAAELAAAGADRIATNLAAVQAQTDGPGLRIAVYP